MSEKSLTHNCGIAAVVLKSKNPSTKVLSYLYRLLLHQQNRGQLSSGFTIFNEEKKLLLDTHKGIGSVDEVFKPRDKSFVKHLNERFLGTCGIGHVRYSTSGSEDETLAQPFERTHGNKWKWFAFSWNGNLANFEFLKNEILKNPNYHLTHNNDTDVILHLLALELKEQKNGDLISVFSNVAKKFDGCFNIVFVNAFGEMIVIRDTLGIRPVVYGENDDAFLVASESNALINCGVKNFKSLPAGHLIYVDKNGNHKIVQYSQDKKISHCMFEWVYFANASSVIDEKSVYLTRVNLGRELAKNETAHLNGNAIVVPVPDTSKPCADAMAYELKIPCVEGLLRNRFVGRTFIEGELRNNKIENKYTVIPEVLENKIVLLVDDSVVRGTTIFQLIKYLKNVGKAKEVHIRISAPPLRNPCFYGIAMPTVSELLIPNYEKKIVNEEISQDILNKIATDLGADSIRYQTISGLIKSIGFKKEELCLACLNGNYPTKFGEKLLEEEWKNFLEKK